MVSRLFSANPFDEDVDKATSELIPKDHDDITLNLDISDQIRSKKVTAKDAMRALKRRITHSNPNVQLLALSLLDTCVKNGGNHFLIEVASREFVDSLVSIVRSPATNPDVRVKLLGLIQTWALAFEGKTELVYVTETYRLLKTEGSVFPKIDKTSSVMIDTATPPEWTDSDECVRCRTPFTMFNRKHHCRNCGKTFCGECSSKTATLPHIGINEQVRVCDACHIKRQLKARNSADFSGPPNTTNTTNPTNPTNPTLYSTSAFVNGNDSYNNNNNNNNSNNSVMSQEEEELKKAIELSLKEAESRNYFQPAQQKVAKVTEPVKKQEEEMDEDLAAAIEASLRDMNINQSRSSSSAQQYSNSSYNAVPNYSSTYTPKLSNLASYSVPHELSTIEAENIYQFSELIERIQQSGGDLMRDRQIQELYDRIGELKPKLTKNLAETIQKHQDLVDMHDKLSQVAKIYNQLLEERMSSAYARRSSSVSYTGAQRATSSMAPGGGTTYPTITTNPTIYTQPSSYPVASAPAPSPTYYSSQSAHPSQYIPPQPKVAESAPIINQQAIPPPLQQQQTQPQQPVQPQQQPVQPQQQLVQPQQQQVQPQQQQPVQPQQQQQVQPQQPQPPQQQQPSYTPYTYTSTPTSYTPNPNPVPTPNENVVNSTGTPGEYNLNVTADQQGYIPQTNGIVGSAGTSYTPQTNGISLAPQPNVSNSAYAIPQANYGVDYGYQLQLQQQQQALPQQQNCYQYQTPPSSQQMHPPVQSHKIEEALLIEL